MARSKVTEANPFCNCAGARHVVCRSWRVSVAENPQPAASAALLRGYALKGKTDRYQPERGTIEYSARGAAHVAALLMKQPESPTFRYTPPHVHTYSEWSAWAASPSRWRVGFMERRRACECGDTQDETQPNATAAAA